MRFSPETLEASLRASLEKKPGLTLRLDLINKCNLRCVMCYYSDDAVFRRPARKVDLEEFQRLYAGLAPYVGKVVLSCGDEPLVSNHFPAVLSYLGDGNERLEIELCTNAMLMNGRIRNLMIAKGVTHLIVSMDGATRATLEAIRVGAKYDKLVANVLALRDLKRAAGSRYPIVIMDYVLMRSNVHEAPAFVELAARMGAQAIDFRHVIPSEYFNDPGDLLENHPALYNRYRREVLRASRRHRVDVVLPPAFPTDERFDGPLPRVDLADFEAVAPDRATGETPVPKTFPRGFRPRQVRGTAAETFASTYCERPFSEVFIAQQDEVKPCAWHRAPLGTLASGQTPAEIFFGESFARLRRNMLRPEGDPDCRGCPVKAGRLSGEYAQYGSPSARAVQRLKRPLKAIVARLRR